MGPEGCRNSLVPIPRKGASTGVVSQLAKKVTGMEVNVRRSMCEMLITDPISYDPEWPV